MLTNNQFFLKGLHISWYLSLERRLTSNLTSSCGIPAFKNLPSAASSEILIQLTSTPTASRIIFSMRDPFAASLDTLTTLKLSSVEVKITVTHLCNTIRMNIQPFLLPTHVGYYNFLLLNAANVSEKIGKKS